MPLAFRRTAVRRLTLAAAPLLLAAALPRPAAAQFDILFPACTTRTLAQYLTQLGCTAGGVVFANFSGSIAPFAAEAGRTLADVLVQPLAVGRTISFAFTLADPLVVTGGPLMAGEQPSPNRLTVAFDAFGLPTAPGGATYLPVLPLLLGNALTAGGGYDAYLYATLEASSPQHGSAAAGAYLQTGEPAFCFVDFTSGDPLPRDCYGDTRGIALPYLAQHVQLDLAGLVTRSAGATSGPPTSVTLGNIAVAFELPPLPVPPEEPQAPPATTVPEPGTWALLGTGLLGVWGATRRRRARPTA